MNQFALTKMTETMMKASERINHIYPGCKLNDEHRIIPDTARRVNFAELKKVFLSTDRELLKQYEWVF